LKALRVRSFILMSTPNRKKKVTISMKGKTRLLRGILYPQSQSSACPVIASLPYPFPKVEQVSQMYPRLATATLLVRR
jgi:hypothetical protein